MGLAPDLVRICEMAGVWHDVGKTHPCFQGSIRLPDERPTRQDLAKAPKSAWQRENLYRSKIEPPDYRPGLRHEMASALALFASLVETQPNHPALRPRPSDLDESYPKSVTTPRAPAAWEKSLADLDASAFNLVAYLVASHHGKVRMSLHASPTDQDYRDKDGRGLPIRGIRENDILPPIPGADGAVLVDTTSLTLEPAHLGLSERTGPSWTERTLELLRVRGPGSLALLEAIIRAADVRASRSGTPDPLLATKEKGR
jgi:CRISPR-associated endonuclease/helicase Cas3